MIFFRIQDATGEVCGVSLCHALFVFRFLMKLNNETVTVELKNGSAIQGTVQGMPPLLNVVFLCRCRHVDEYSHEKC